VKIASRLLSHTLVSIASESYGELIGQLADALAERGHKLLVFSNIDPNGTVAGASPVRT